MQMLQLKKVVFKVHGKIYHKFGSILFFPSENLNFSQICFMDDAQLEANPSNDGTKQNII